VGLVGDISKLLDQENAGMIRNQTLIDMVNYLKQNQEHPVQGRMCKDMVHFADQTLRKFL
jgi:hypothetical protein